ncbi:MAG: hypothetical protein OEV87_06610 [Phycisphaerae bacterium]|nr:hypothetical protein [Phycisphaerae bacterium]
MNAIFIGFSAIIALVSPFLCFVQARKYTLYTFVFLTIISPILWGYTATVGLQIGDFTWSIADILLVLLLLIAFPLSSQYAWRRNVSFMDFSVLMLVILCLINIAVGRYRMGSFGGVLTVLRYFMCIPVYFVAVNILSRVEDVKLFYLWIMRFIIFVFLLHMLIALKIYYPPLSYGLSDRLEYIEYQEFLRSAIYFFEPFYITAGCVSLCYIMYASSKKKLAIIALACSAVGALATMTRGIYGGLFLVLLGVVGLAKGKIRGMVIVLMIVAIVFVAFQIAQSMGVNLLYRFTGHKMVGQGFVGGTRWSEFASIAESFDKAPAALLSGQGFGVMHNPRAARNQRSYFHNDYLMALYSFGIIGLACFLYLLFSSILRGHMYCKNKEMALLLMPIRLILFATAGMCIFNSQFWVYKGSALLMVLLAISSNTKCYIQQAYTEEELLYNFAEGYELYAV